MSIISIASIAGMLSTQSATTSVTDNSILMLKTGWKSGRTRGEQCVGRDYG
jgi:hypothetical protein